MAAVPRPSIPASADRSWRRAWGAPLVLVALVAVLVGYPLGAVVVRGVRHALAQGWENTPPLLPSPALIASTLAWSVGIALLATLFALPMAWALRRHGAPMAAILITPLLLPSYLVYHAMGLNRAPQTLLGDLIESTATHGLEWLPVLVGRVLALLGLAIWSAPLAALVLGSALRGVDPGVLDALRADGTPWLRRHVVILTMLRRSVVTSVGLIVLLMLGSAVPLHLAQAPTLAISTWLAIMISPEDARSWLTGWPLVVVAMAGAWWLSRASGLAALALVQGGGERRDERVLPSRGGVRSETVFSLCFVLSATLVPVVLYVLTLRDWTLVPTFLRLTVPAMVRGVAIALGVGLVGLGLALLGMRAWSRGATGWVRVALAGLALAMLTPGIMVGQAFLAASLPLGAAFFDGPVPTIACHVARCGALALACGVMLAASESPDVRDARRLDVQGGLAGFLGWWQVCVRPHAGALAGVAIAMACLSFHEIEASIILQPIGSVSFAQTMLGQLHFARQDELAAGAIVVVSLGTLAGFGAAWLLAGGRRVREAAGRAPKT